MVQNGNAASGPITLAGVANVVRQHYGEDIWKAVKVALAVIVSLSLKGRDNCVVIVYEGPSGRGKSIIIRLVMSDRISTEAFLFRVDDFTPASFGSHAANKKPAQLKLIDLLPQVKDKVMLTKELAPVFRDDEKVLRQNFARLTSILDGNGYTTVSGVHGKRGYAGQYVFTWIGATTPIPDRTFRVMAQLGNRILFYEITGDKWSEDKLMDFAQNYGADNAIKESQTAVNDFLEGHFKKHPADSVDPQSIVIPEDLTRKIVRYASLIAHGRVELEIEYVHGTGIPAEYEAGTPEGPQRVILLLQTIVRGLALTEDRNTATEDDLEPIRHIAFSSTPPKRRELLRAVIQAGGSLDSGQVEKALGVSRPTAIKRMKELAATKIVVFTQGVPATSTPDIITLAQEWLWLLDGSTPLKQIGSVCGSISLGTIPP